MVSRSVLIALVCGFATGCAYAIVDPDVTIDHIDVRIDPEFPPAWRRDIQDAVRATSPLPIEPPDTIVSRWSPWSKLKPGIVSFVYERGRDPQPMSVETMQGRDGVVLSAVFHVYPSSEESIRARVEDAMRRVFA